MTQLDLLKWAQGPRVVAKLPRKHCGKRAHHGTGLVGDRIQRYADCDACNTFFVVRTDTVTARDYYARPPVQGSA